LRGKNKITLFLIAVVIVLIVVLAHWKGNFPCSAEIINNLFFSVFALSSVGIGMTYSNYEVDELKRTKDNIRNSGTIPAKYKDMLMFDITGKIKEYQPLIKVHGGIYFWIIITSLVGIIVNLFLPKEGWEILKEILRSAALSVAFISGAAIMILRKQKQYLMDLATSGYDQQIQQAKDLLSGKYESFLPD